ncbi:MAG: protein phosphatase 2C domain-containing protein [Mycobacterium leprae]
MRLVFSHRSHPGLVRPTNQDAYSVDRLEMRLDAALLVVADGMGGYEGGEVASQLAVTTVRNRVLASAESWAESGLLLTGLAEAVAEANRAILAAQVQHPEIGSMGTTLTIALIWGERILIGHVGDSKACLITGDTVSTVTSDHNVAGELVQIGQLTAEQAAHHPQRHVLTRALGIGDPVRVEQLELAWHPGDILLLNTDGLSNLVQLSEIQESSKLGFESLTTRLVDLALERGGFDNITVLAARWEE